MSDDDDTKGTLAPMKVWLEASLEAPVESALARLRRADDVRRIAVMPDVHLSSDVCIGVVMATNRLLYPAAVGGDIGCGMLAIAFDVEASAVADDPRRAGEILRSIGQAVPVKRRHRARRAPVPSDLESLSLSHGALESVMRSEGVLQLGTLGGGNHFGELQADEDGRLWLMIHSGSRAMGQAIRGHHLSRAFETGTALRALDVSNDSGKAYASDVAWARCYADANRRAMAAAVVGVLKEALNARPIESSLITCDHNHVALETHEGRAMWVHRKGAMPAGDGVAGVLPGSMGTQSFHVMGRGCVESLQSSAHGAGRMMSRNLAREHFTAREVCRQMSGVWFDYRLAPNLRDEAPGAYKDVRRVMRAQRELVSIVRTLRPILTYKSG